MGNVVPHPFGKSARHQGYGWPSLLQPGKYSDISFPAVADRSWTAARLAQDFGGEPEAELHHPGGCSARHRASFDHWRRKAVARRRQPLLIDSDLVGCPGSSNGGI